VEQVLTANRLFADGAIDYVGVGPVFATPSKPDHAPPLGVDGLRRLCALSDTPTVAIGGIHAGNADAVMEADGGPDGIAVVSALCGAPEPATVARQLRVIADRAMEERKK
jgi:thiamine-phosphate pyrophosphorylase